MSGIYLHIPFCRQSCHYCDFHFSTSQQTKDDVLLCMQQELQMRKEELPEPVQTIYLGGGTPSIVKTGEIQQLLDAIFKHNKVVSDAEITLEANPDDLTLQKIKELRNTPINRFSIGVQSFHEEDLKYLHRIHSTKQAEYAIKGAQDAGFENITIDLIYGIPTLTHSKWIENLHKAIQFSIPHISAYALTVEEQTPLHHLIRRKKKAEPDDEHAAEHFFILIDTLTHAGFEHYEISNFALPGYRSRHNSSYWDFKPYLGIGPSAHSYNGYDVRRWNVSSNVRYIQGIKEGTPWYETEQLTFENRVNEWVMVKLRLIEGIKKEQFVYQFNNDTWEYVISLINSNQLNSYFTNSNDSIVLNKQGKILFNIILSKLIIG
ncbi:MAG: radical SAM family heme chaperone HemW [Flavobacteriales bacterium]|nr:radical SAM family heme chaperone HemW [Flavobacteriales bacterium]